MTIENSTGWSYPTGRTVPQVAEDPGTPEYGLLAIPVLDAATFHAMLGNPNITYAVVSRLVEVASSSTLSWPLPFSPDRSFARALLRCSLLDAGQLVLLLDMFEPDSVLIIDVSAHPAFDVSVAVQLVRSVASDTRAELTGDRYCDSVRAVAALLLTDPGLLRSRAELLGATAGLLTFGVGAVDVVCGLAGDGWCGPWQDAVDIAAAVLS